MKISEASEVTFNIDGSQDKHCTFFAIYAGLRMYEALKRDQHIAQNLGKPYHEIKVNIARLEAINMLNQLEEQFPEDFIEAEIEYELKIQK